LKQSSNEPQVGGGLTFEVPDSFAVADSSREDGGDSGAVEMVERGGAVTTIFARTGLNPT
jgi:hypothetical protein